jgi:hypothetical protein
MIKNAIREVTRNEFHFVSITCDRCGAVSSDPELGPRWPYQWGGYEKPAIETTIELRYKNDYDNSGNYEEYIAGKERLDLCPDCFHAMIAFLKREGFLK